LADDVAATVEHDRVERRAGRDERPAVGVFDRFGRGALGFAGRIA
jgi:hypothetical protein